MMTDPCESYMWGMAHQRSDLYPVMLLWTVVDLCDELKIIEGTFMGWFYEYKSIPKTNLSHFLNTET